MYVLPLNQVTLRSFLLLILCVCFYGCVQPLTVPIGTERLSDEHLPHHLLFVYLPGNGDPPAAFERHGLAAMVRDRGIPADIIAVNALLGYYENGTILDRLKQDVIDPQSQRGTKGSGSSGTRLAHMDLCHTLPDIPTILPVLCFWAFTQESGGSYVRSSRPEG